MLFSCAVSCAVSWFICHDRKSFSLHILHTFLLESRLNHICDYFSALCSVQLKFFFKWHWQQPAFPLPPYFSNMIDCRNSRMACHTYCQTYFSLFNFFGNCWYFHCEHWLGWALSSFPSSAFLPFCMLYKNRLFRTQCFSAQYEKNASWLSPVAYLSQEKSFSHSEWYLHPSS